MSTLEANYAISDLKTLAVVWAVTHFHYYLYGHNVTDVTDHAAVKAILGAPNLTGKHARWWSKVYSSGIRHLEIVHCLGENSLNVDCLSQQSDMPAGQEDDDEVQIALVSCHLPDTIEEALEQDPMVVQNSSNGIGEEHLKDKELRPIILYLRDGSLPNDPTLSYRVAAVSILSIIMCFTM